MTLEEREREVRELYRDKAELVSRHLYLGPIPPYLDGLSASSAWGQAVPAVLPVLTASPLVTGCVSRGQQRHGCQNDCSHQETMVGTEKRSPN